MSDLIDPNDFVITRKRKKYKFAKFHNAPNCFELDDWTKRSVDIIEVGAGSALFSVELAARYPDKTVVALDVKADRLQQGAYAALERGIQNVQFVRARADQITEICQVRSVAQIWVTFPDPFPKARSAARRLSHPSFLAKYREILQPSGSLCLKHDNPEFFCWSLEQLVGDKWYLAELSFDLHDSSLSDVYKILTTYELRWLDEGRKTCFVRACARELT